MKKLCLLGLFVSLASHNVLAATTPAPLENKDAFVSNLMKQMTLDEKIGQPKFRERLLLFGYRLKRPEPKKHSQMADAFSRRASF